MGDEASFYSQNLIGPVVITAQTLVLPSVVSHGLFPVFNTTHSIEKSVRCMITHEAPEGSAM